MLTKAISWMKSLIVSPTPRGIPVSPVRSWILVTCIIYASATRNKSPRASPRRSKSCSFQESYHPLRGDISTTDCYHELVVMPPYPPLCFIGVHVINCWAVSAQPCIIFSTPGIFFFCDQDIVYQWEGILLYWSVKGIGLSINILLKNRSWQILAGLYYWKWRVSRPLHHNIN